MQPLFRSDLKCSREEQQGVVFYRVDDPSTQTSFRLYEIEYLIAQKLDGRRTIAEVLSAVKAEHNFDISEPDLTKFVGQLESMGFVTRGGPTMASGGDIMELGTSDFSDITDVSSMTEGVDYDPDATAQLSRPQLAALDFAADEGPIDEAERDRLLRSALLHIKQGYLVHARDYVLAARELQPTEPKLMQLANYFDVLGDGGTPEEVAHLWEQARAMFPEIAEEIGPLLADDTESKQGAGKGTVWDDDLRARVRWTVLVLVLLLAGAGGLLWAVKQGRWFESDPQVRVQRLQGLRVPVFAGTAKSVSAARELWLTFEGSGKVVEVLAREGTDVRAGDILARLELPRPMARQMAQSQTALEKAKKDYESVTKRLEKLFEQQSDLEAEQAAAEQKLRELQAKSLGRQGGVSKRDYEKWKRQKAAANRKLSALAKKTRKPKAEAKKAKKKLDAAASKLEKLERKVAPSILRAPFDGRLEEVSVAVGDQVTPKRQVMLLRDRLAVRLVFSGASGGAWQPGGEAYVGVAGGAPSRGKVLEGTSPMQVVVSLPDATGAFLGMKPDVFSLVRELVEPAFRVPNSALFHDGEATYLFLALQSRAKRRQVEILEKGASETVVRDPLGTLRDGQWLVVERPGERDVSSIADGDFLELLNQGGDAPRGG